MLVTGGGGSLDGLAATLINTFRDGTGNGTGTGDATGSGRPAPRHAGGAGAPEGAGVGDRNSEADPEEGEPAAVPSAGR